MQLNHNVKKGFDCVDYLKANPTKADKSKIMELSVITLGSDTEASLTGNDSDWEEPDYFTEVSLPDIPSNILPGVYGEFAESLAEATETPKALAVFDILGTVSAAVSHLFHVSPKPGWNESCNLYVLVGLPPANLKSLVLKESTRSLADWEKGQAKQILSEIVKAESKNRMVEKAIKGLEKKATKNPESIAKTMEEVEKLTKTMLEVPTSPQVFATDITPEQLATLIDEQNGTFALLGDEGGIFDVLGGLYSGGQANIDIILKGWDGGQVKLWRKDKYINVEPNLTFMITAQPTIIQKLGNQKSFQGKGLLERFDYLLPESNIGSRSHTTKPVEDSLRKKYNDQIKHLLVLRLGNPKRKKLTLSKNAYEEWHKFQLEVEQMLKLDGRLSHLDGWGGKFPGKILRYAGLLHVMEHGVKKAEISASTIKKTLLLAEPLIAHALAAFSLMTTGSAIDEGKVIFKWIVSKGESSFTRRDCFRAFQKRFDSVEDLDHCLTELKNKHFIRELPSKSTGGRPSNIWEINPKIINKKN